MRLFPNRFFPYLFIIAIVLAFVIACNNAPAEKESMTKGVVNILVDETFAPIIEDQLAVFENSYAEADITLINRPEKEVINKLIGDSAKIAILARKLSPEEEKFFESKKIYPRTTKFATDAVALITNSDNKDSVTTVEDIIKIMRGEPSGISSLVFDNPNSSTVRYLQELASVKTLPQKGVYALKDNPSVIEYVYNNPKAIGVIGINWLMQPQADLLPLIEKIKVLAIKGKAENKSLAVYYKPTQSNLALGVYPLSRDLYLINCQIGRGLGMGFASFLYNERGQRIILKSGLLPDSIPPREIRIIK